MLESSEKFVELSQNDPAAIFKCVRRFNCLSKIVESFNSVSYIDE